MKFISNFVVAAVAGTLKLLLPKGVVSRIGYRVLRSKTCTVCAIPLGPDMRCSKCGCTMMGVAGPMMMSRDPIADDCWAERPLATSKPPAGMVFSLDFAPSGMAALFNDNGDSDEEGEKTC